MPWQEVNAESIRWAIAEFDRVGRDTFLELSEIGPAKKHFIIENGQQYDAKAIWAVAHHHQFPHEEKLTKHNWHHGRALRALYGKLGFIIQTVRTRSD